jgi:hypothetical protein
MMKKFLLTTLIMIAGLFTLAGAARAQTALVVVHMNEDFVAGGKILPAGTYKVYEGSPAWSQTLILRGETDSVVLMPIMHDHAFPEQLKVKLTRAGDVYCLSEVATDLGDYTFPAPRALTPTAKVEDQNLKPASGTN